MACLDTDLLVGFLRQQPEALVAFQSLESNGASVSTTVVSACELFEGAYRMRDPTRAVKAVRDLLGSMKLLDLSLFAAERFGYLKSDLQKTGRHLEDFDVLIAAIVLDHDEELVTRNTRHFDRVPGLRLIRW